MIARPVSLPPAWTIRRAEWPPSRPSASSPSGSVSKRTPRLISCSTAAGRLAGEHLDRARAAEAAAGVERVGGVALGRVVRGERRREPALGPEARALGERLSRDQRRPGPARPPPRARRAARRRRRRPATSRARCAARVARAGYGTPVAMTLYCSRIPPRIEHDTGGAPGERRPAAGDRGRARSRRPAGARAGRGAGGHPRAAAARPHRRAHRRDRGVLRARRRDDRHRHGRQRRLVRGGASRGRRRRRGGRAAARRRGAGGLLRPAPAGPPRRARPGDGLLPVQQRRRRRRATRSTAAAPSGC